MARYTYYLVRITHFKIHFLDLTVIINPATTPTLGRTLSSLEILVSTKRGKDLYRQTPGSRVLWLTIKDSSP
nr:hypothetical transcript [Hymenolepis microstoma]